MSELPPDLSRAPAAGRLSAPAWKPPQRVADDPARLAVTLDDATGPTVTVTITLTTAAVLADSLAAVLRHRCRTCGGPWGSRARPLPVVVEGVEGGTVQVVDVDGTDRLAVRVRQAGVELATRPAVATVEVYTDLLAHAAAEAFDSRRMPR